MQREPAAGRAKTIMLANIIMEKNIRQPVISAGITIMDNRKTSGPSVPFSVHYPPKEKKKNLIAQKGIAASRSQSI
jgi:hypothetical protein